jgi:hypothetical protein
MSFTMRFPRAETIRDDLDAEDCASASGWHLSLGILLHVLTFSLDVIAALRREKKRKIEDTARQVEYKSNLYRF